MVPMSEQMKLTMSVASLVKPVVSALEDEKPPHAGPTIAPFIDRYVKQKSPARFSVSRFIATFSQQSTPSKADKVFFIEKKPRCLIKHMFLKKQIEGVMWIFFSSSLSHAGALWRPHLESIQQRRSHCNLQSLSREHGRF